MGNLQVRFLEGWAPAMAPGYSTPIRLLQGCPSSTENRRQALMEPPLRESLVNSARGGASVFRHRRLQQLGILRLGFLQVGIAAFEWGKADTPRQVLEAWVIPQAVHARIYMKIDKPVGVLFVGFLQVFHSAVVFSQADVYPGEEVGCDILLLC